MDYHNNWLVILQRSKMHVSMVKADYRIVFLATFSKI